MYLLKVLWIGLTNYSECFVYLLQQHTLALTEDKSADHEEDLQRPEKAAGRTSLTIDILQAQAVEVLPVVSPTSISIDKAGLPLAIFTKVTIIFPQLLCSAIRNIISILLQIMYVKNFDV